MTTRGRPRIGPAVTIRLEPELRTELDAICEYSGLPLSALIRHVLRRWATLEHDGAYEDARLWGLGEEIPD